jgi:hypothetical protein
MWEKMLSVCEEYDDNGDADDDVFDQLIDSFFKCNKEKFMSKLHKRQMIQKKIDECNLAALLCESGIIVW